MFKHDSKQGKFQIRSSSKFNKSLIILEYFFPLYFHNHIHPIRGKPAMLLLVGLWHLKTSGNSPKDLLIRLFCVSTYSLFKRLSFVDVANFCDKIKGQVFKEEIFKPQMSKWFLKRSKSKEKVCAWVRWWWGLPPSFERVSVIIVVQRHLSKLVLKQLLNIFSKGVPANHL